MKKWILFLSAYLCLCLLAACGAAGSGDTVPGSTPSPGAVPTAEKQTDGERTPPASLTMTCRIVEVGDGNRLLLADTESDGVYTLSAGDAELLMDGEDPNGIDWAPNAGALAEVTYDGMILETWPAQFANVTSVNILSEDFDDRCALYLRVLEDLWAVDAGLNSDTLTYIGMDLSQTSLSQSEQAAVAWAFAQKHGAEPVQGTFAELAEQGYFAASPISTPAPEKGEPAPAAWYQWEDGILFSITEKDDPVVFSLPNIGEGADTNLSAFNVSETVSFDAQKWRSGTGAYYFCGCVALRDNNGHWGDYTVSAEAIS